MEGAEFEDKTKANDHFHVPIIHFSRHPKSSWDVHAKRNWKHQFIKNLGGNKVQDVNLETFLSLVRLRCLAQSFALRLLTASLRNADVFIEHDFKLPCCFCSISEASKRRRQSFQRLERNDANKKKRSIEYARFEDDGAKNNDWSKTEQGNAVPNYKWMWHRGDCTVHWKQVSINGNEALVVNKLCHASKN